MNTSLGDNLPARDNYKKEGFIKNKALFSYIMFCTEVS